MKTSTLHELIDTTVSPIQRKNHAAVKQLMGILDLEPPLDPDGLHKAVDEELEDQCLCLVAALKEVATAHAELTNGVQKVIDLIDNRDEAFPLKELQACAALSAPQIKTCIENAIGRHERFQSRLGWLLRPSTLEEVATLDPFKDRNQIYHFISYDFRLEQKLFAVLFELSASLAPYASLLFYSTGEFEHRAFKRINDTVMFFSNMIEWGLESKRGREAVERVNGIHGRYSFPNELFKFILQGIMFIPILWNEKLGRRKFTEVERMGWFHTFAEMGRAMHVQGITDDYDEMYAQWQETMNTQGETSEIGTHSFHMIVVQVLATYPEPLRGPLLGAIVCGMPEQYREVLDVPEPPKEWVEGLRTTLMLVGKAGEMLPRVPWIRSLQLHPLYKDVNKIGVSARSAYLPLTESDHGVSEKERLKANDGRPEGQHPIEKASQTPVENLPEISLEELAKHNQPNDAWFAAHGYVYNITRFFKLHPGGDKVLLANLGKDASVALDRAGHSESALIMMVNFRIGRLANQEVKEFPEEVVPGGKIHTGRRVGKDKAYQRGDWQATLDYFERTTAEYVQRKHHRVKKTEATPVPQA